jgi:hypothetical protein
MKCNLGHEHPPMVVKAATDNPTNQPRPFHCPDCYQVTMPRAKPENWCKYKTPAEARAAGHPLPCKSCFG